MAKWITLCFLVVCLAVIILTLVDNADAARGGRFSSRSGRYGTRVRVRNRISSGRYGRTRYGGTRYSGTRYTGTRYTGTRYGGTRFSGTRYGSSRVRIRQRVRYRGSSRMYKGSYGLTRSTWKNAFLLGTIYHGPWYLRSRRYHSHPNNMPTICRNNYETDDNNTVYNLFFCPRFFEPDDFEYCCGPELREYCCKYFDSAGRTAGIVIGVLVVVVIVGIIVYCVCKKRSNQGGKVLSPFSKPEPAYAITNQYSPAPTMTYAAPVQPPPAAAGPPPGYPDAEGKPNLPPGEVSHGGMPYPPPQGGMYPPAAGYGAPPGYEAVSTGYPPQPPPGAYPPPTGPGGYPPPTVPGAYPPPQPSGY